MGYDLSSTTSSSTFTLRDVISYFTFSAAVVSSDQTTDSSHGVTTYFVTYLCVLSISTFQIPSLHHSSTSLRGAHLVRELMGSIFL